MKILCVNFSKICNDAERENFVCELQQNFERKRFAKMKSEVTVCGSFDKQSDEENMKKTLMKGLMYNKWSRVRVSAAQPRHQ